MKAMILNAHAPIEESPLHWRDVPDPEPGEREVRIRVRCCALCRTDLHVIEADLPTRRMPVICGHQAIGVVDKRGSGCRLLEVGQRVGIAWLRKTCGSCRFCLSGRENLCEQSLYTGYDHDGGYAELAVIDEAYAYPVPAGFDDVHAAPLLCAGIVGYRALVRSRVPAGGRLALFGFGSSAHLMLQIAIARRCEVYVVSRGAGHRELAEKMGARWTGADGRDLPQKMDSGIIFAPAGSLVPIALDCLEKGGTLALAGIHMSEIPPLEYQSLFFEKDIRSVTSNTREDGRTLLAEASSIQLEPRVHQYPLADANRALQDLKADRIDGTGVLLVES